MNNKIIIPFEEAQHQIEEADVLIFRGNGFISNMIKIFSNGIYSHVGIASWSNNGMLECVEFREFLGGRTVSLEQYVKQMGGDVIDVYRPASTFSSLLYSSETGNVSKTTEYLRRKDITDCMRGLTGLPYGWSRIWAMAARQIPVIRTYRPKHIFQDSPSESPIDLVCSTVVAHCFSKNYVDLAHNISDDYMTPSDVSRSPVLNYLFTLGG